MPAAVGRSAVTFIVEMFFLLISAGCNNEEAQAEILIIWPLVEGERLPGLTVRVLMCSGWGTECFQRGSHFVFLNVGLLSEADLEGNDVNLPEQSIVTGPTCRC